MWSRAIHPPITDEALARRWERIGAAQRAAWASVAARYGECGSHLPVSKPRDYIPETERAK
jgi:hypothetical protein